jgi:hypothetical protein
MEATPKEDIIWNTYHRIDNEKENPKSTKNPHGFP